MLAMTMVEMIANAATAVTAIKPPHSSSSSELESSPVTAGEGSCVCVRGESVSLIVTGQCHDDGAIGMVIVLMVMVMMVLLGW